MLYSTSLIRRLLRRLLEPLFDALYHRFSWVYDAAAWVVSLGRWNPCIRYFASFIHQGPVLELGHGPGFLQIELDKLFFAYAGIDESKQMVRRAAKKISKSGASPRVINSLAQALPFSNASYSTVVSTYPAPYIFDRETLIEVYRVITPGGELLVLVTTWFFGKGFLKGFWSWLSGGELAYERGNAWLRRIFEELPWLVEIFVTDYQDDRLLIVRCRKPADVDD